MEQKIREWKQFLKRGGGKLDQGMGALKRGRGSGTPYEQCVHSIGTRLKK